MADPVWKKGTIIRQKGTYRWAVSCKNDSSHNLFVRACASEKFGRNLQNSDFFSFNFDTDFQIESYLKHQEVHCGV